VESLLVSDAANVVSATDSERYPGLRVDDLACFWVEGVGGHFIIRLPNSADQVKQTLRVLSASAKDAKSFRQLEENYMAAKPVEPGGGPQIPRWFAIGGYITGVVTLLFFMGVVFASMFNH
jgi:hypothetical protein